MTSTREATIAEDPAHQAEGHPLHDGFAQPRVEDQQQHRPLDPHGRRNRP
ncbi:hypothetical protein [Streptomyces sp. CB03238]|nr:hypothetical protein [Streptomyces sp. CB03238]